MDLSGKIQFVFGPNESFFFDSPKAWKWMNLPTALECMFDRSLLEEKAVKQPYGIALGTRGSWMIAFTDLEGNSERFACSDNFDSEYPEFSSWISGNLLWRLTSSDEVKITLGPAGSYWLQHGFGSTRGELPVACEMQLAKYNFQKPKTIALGYNGAYLYLREDGYSWNFGGNYADLDRILDNAVGGSIETIALSPFNPSHWFLVFKNGTTQWHVPESWVPRIREVVNTYTESSGGFSDSASTALTSQRISYTPNVREAFGRQFQVPNNIYGPSRTQEWIRTAVAVVGAVGTFVPSIVAGGLSCAVM